MIKICHFAILFACIGALAAHGIGRQPWYYFFAQPFLTPTSICANATTQTSYISGVLTLLNTLQQDATYNATLQRRSPNFISYIGNPTNRALLFSNCPAFVTGVKTAKSADSASERSRCLIAQDISQRLQQVSRAATGSTGPNDLDSNEKHDHHC